MLSYLKDLKSSRTEEFRIECNDRFELSTLFKSAEEIAALQRWIAEQEEAQSDDSELPQTVV